METLDSKICERARLARDARFDGLFFVGVKSTGIYCRPICPAPPAQEKNVCYFRTAIEAANAGFRPCLRCRPESSPGSSAWLGTQTSFNRALKLIDGGVLQRQSLEALSERLGITSRYLRQLFQRYLGVSPKSYALYQQCLFAKKLLHQTGLPVTDIALASGFRSIRRFNDCFKKTLGLAPTQIRKKGALAGESITLKLYYRPPYSWAHFVRFLEARAVDALEWCDGYRYGRTIQYRETAGQFEISPEPGEHYVAVRLNLNDWRHLQFIVRRIQRILDLNVDAGRVDAQLKPLFSNGFAYQKGLRLPGIWNLYEAGVRAVLGQQVSVKMATRLVTALVAELGAPAAGGRRFFPRPEQVAEHELAFLGMPESRKRTLRDLSRQFRDQPAQTDLQQWLAIKGIGPWTVDYVSMRGSSNPDVWLASDLGVQQALERSGSPIDASRAKPWRSYLTVQLWNQL